MNLIYNAQFQTTNLFVNKFATTISFVYLCSTKLIVVILKVNFNHLITPSHHHNMSKKPTEAELEILQILWAQGPSTVRSVNDALNTQRKVGYTTTLKLMQIMTEKGFVQRNESGRSHIYETIISESATQKSLLSRFLDKTFKGSALKLVMQALGNHQTTQEELQQIRDLLDQLEEEGKEEL